MTFTVSAKLYFAHEGVKGMRWGHRKLEEVGGEIVRQRGENVHHVTGDTKLSLSNDKGLYTSFTKEDVAIYRSEYAMQLIAMRNFKKVYDYKITATETLVSPTKQKRIDEFVKLHQHDDTIVAIMGKDKTTNGLIAATFTNVSKFFGYDRTSKQTAEYRRLIESKDPKDKEKAFRDFSKYLGLSYDMQRKYFKQLSKQGFNSIYDDNDIFAGYSERPLIVFNPSKSLKVDSKDTISEHEIYD